MKADSQTGVRVHSLYNLGTFVVNHPVRIDLGVSVWIKHDCLIGPGFSKQPQATLQLESLFVMEFQEHAYCDSQFKLPHT